MTEVVLNQTFVLPTECVEKILSFAEIALPDSKIDWQDTKM